MIRIAVTVVLQHLDHSALAHAIVTALLYHPLQLTSQRLELLDAEHDLLEVGAGD